jgi:tetrahydromethanopterin S-methyltransferase subunit D
VSSRGKLESYVHVIVAVGEVLAPCSYDVVAVGGALEPCRSTAVGAVGSMLTSPCFRRGLRAAVVMEHAGCHHYLFIGASQMGRWSCSP